MLNTKAFHLRLRSRFTPRGVTLIDALVGTALMLVIFLGIVGVFQLSIDVVTNNKARAGAIALANERVEYVRGLTYDQVGTIGGIPYGVIPQEESVTLNGVDYIRRVYIQYADDPADGLGAADNGQVIADYKVVRVNVYWTARTGERHIVMLTRMSPAGEESNVPGGTLTLTVLNSLSQPVQNAEIRVVNTGTTPASQAIDFTTYSNSVGMASFIGATSSGAYQITVTKPSYSTDQTYGVTAQNTNPDPGHLSVYTNQTTAQPFWIDVLGQKTIKTYTQILASTSTDSFTDSAALATTSNVTVSGGSAHLQGEVPYPSVGTLQSIAIAPADLARWKSLSWTDTKPEGTGVVYRVYNSSGTALIPDSELPGNSAGFTTSPVSLLTVSTSTYTGIRIGATLTSTGDNTPSIEARHIAYDYGPLPLPNIAFTVRGNKRIGSGPSGALYKYGVDHSSGSSASLTIGNLEWDAYTIIVPVSSGYDIASACHPPTEYQAQPASTTVFTFPAGGSTVSSLFLAPHTSHSVLVDVRSAAAGALIRDASVRLWRTGYDTTITTDACGQAFFGGLTNAPYSISVSAAGYTTYIGTDAVTVNGTSKFPVELN